VKVVYWKCEKEGFAVAGYAASLDDAEEAAKGKVGRLNADWREDYDYRTQLQKFDFNLKSLVQILEIAHSAGRMAERQSHIANYAIK
tara:strand:+ start:2801 stop:3061 length:261 start_codon:yes stop_codon:yes gene_type:complete